MQRRNFLTSLFAILGLGTTKATKARPITDDRLCLEAALALRGGLESIDKHYDPATLARAKRRFRDISLWNALAILAGDRAFEPNDTPSLLRAAFPECKPGTRDAGTFLASLANKFMTQGFHSVEDSWRKTASIRSVVDFKMMEYHSMANNGHYIRHPGISRIKASINGQTTYTEECSTYGKMHRVTVADIESDNLDAITFMATKLGRGSALRFNDVFWDLSREIGGAPIEVSFLNGEEMPIIAYAELDRESLAIEFRGYYDFGCARGD